MCELRAAILLNGFAAFRIGIPTSESVLSRPEIPGGESAPAPDPDDQPPAAIPPVEDENS